MKNGTMMLSALAVLATTTAAHANRGSDGQLNIIYWQAPSTMNPFLSSGTKDIEAASLVLEPLARYDNSGNMVPWLAESVPTLGNGGVSADLRSITWKLKSGLKWSDGTRVTAKDVVFTWKYCMHPEGGCSFSENFKDVAKVKAVDELTVKVTFGVPKPFPYGPFVGARSPIIQAAQFADCLGTKAPQCTQANFGPIGTGPFKVTAFRPNDVVSLKANEHYRDPDKPAFATVNFKGGGKAAAAARSVLETGEFDYAWNLQLPPDVLTRMKKAGKGHMVAAFGTTVERLEVNLTNPAPGLGKERSTAKHPHPFLVDGNVRKALSMAIDRRLLTEIGYGQAGDATCNILPAPKMIRSTANDGCLRQDIEGAKKVLNDAGWKPGPDGVRQKNGVRLSLLFQTSTNGVRQDFQALIKQWWAKIGVETELRNISASVFFGGDAGSPDTIRKFYADVEMFANGFYGTDPETYMAKWTCNQAPRPKNQWQGNNVPRYCNKAYDALVSRMAEVGDLAERNRLAKALNDKLIQDYVVIPLVHRGRVSARSKSLGGVKLNTWDSELWNIAEWHRLK